MRKTDTRRLLAALVLLSFLLGASPSVLTVAAASRDEGTIKLIGSDATGVSIEVMAPSFQLQPVAARGHWGAGKPASLATLPIFRVSSGDPKPGSHNFR